MSICNFFIILNSHIFLPPGSAGDVYKRQLLHTLLTERTPFVFSSFNSMTDSVLFTSRNLFRVDFLAFL